MIPEETVNMGPEPNSSHYDDHTNDNQHLINPLETNIEDTTVLQPPGRFPNDSFRNRPTSKKPTAVNRLTTRTSRPPKRYHDEFVNLIEASPTIEDALAGPQSVHWKAAIKAELEQLQKYGVYGIVDEIPDGHKPVDTKWVLREKRDSKGEILKYKPRLTGRGFTQIIGLHYNET
jgi:hypothetical protein